jgi:general stress protein 26
VTSIDQEQADHHEENLTGIDAVDRIRTLVEPTRMGFLVTVRGSRPMTVLKVDAEGCLWFLSSKDSSQNADIAADPRVEFYLANPDKSEFLHLRGSASVKVEKLIVHDLWTPVAKAWFTEGEDDPRITVIHLRPSEGHYWDTKHNKLVSGAKIILGAMIGKTLDDGVTGSLAPGAP